MPFEAPPQFNLADYCLDQRVAEGLGERVALRCGSERLTYRQLQALANRLARSLVERGVQPEQRVLLALPDGFWFAASLFGILKAGAVVVMVNPDLSSDEIAFMLSYSRARLAIVAASQSERWQLAPQVWAISEETGGELEHHPAERENFPSHRDDAALWIFSGGTTGRPKAAIQPHRSFANSCECYAKAFLGYGPDDVTLAVPKLYFGYATGSNLIFPLSVGGTACLFPDRSTPETLAREIARHRPTILVNLPTMVHKQLEHPDAATWDLSCLRLATSAGEALPPSLYQRWRRTFGVELVDGLGTAEMWHIFLSNRPGEVKPGTLGRAVPGFEVKVADDEGRELPDGEVGRLWVRGGSRALGYWQQLEKSQEAFQGGWYASQDLVWRDSEGYFSHCGRGDEMLKISGQWLAPQEVEDCLLQHPAVKECALVGIPTDDGLTRPRAYVVPSRACTEQELKAFCLERMAPYKHPREVVFLEELPRTHLGKVDRGKLRSL